MTITTDTATFPLFSAKSPQIDETPIIKTTLPGDLLLNGDTQSDKVIEVTPENSLKFTGSLDVSSIKEQMKKIEQQYGKSGADLENIKLHNPESTFTAKIILPKGLKAKNNLAVGTDVQLEGAAGTFAIVDAKNDGNGVITVKMTLQNTDKIKNMKIRSGITEADQKAIFDAVKSCAADAKFPISEDQLKHMESVIIKKAFLADNEKLARKAIANLTAGKITVTLTQDSYANAMSAKQERQNRRRSSST